MKNNLIFALDTHDIKTIRKYAKKIAQIRKIPDDRQTSSQEKILKSIFAIKVGLLNITDSGLSIIKELKQITNMEIVCDLKLADIPYIAGEVAKKVAEAGADYLVVHSFVGEKPIIQLFESVPDMKIILVSEMTHNDGGFTEKHLAEFVDMAKKLKVFGIVGPGNKKGKIKLIKDIVGDEIKIIAAGVTPQQGGEEKNALEEGADLLIKGREIMKILDEQIESTLFDFESNRIIQNILLPTAFYLSAGILLFLILNYLQLGDIAQRISITLFFVILGLIPSTVLRKL